MLIFVLGSQARVAGSKCTISSTRTDWRDSLAHPELCLHLYGKLEIREGGKMGHVTRVFPEPPDE